MEESTQKYVWITRMNQDSVTIDKKGKEEKKFLVAGVFCPDVNSKLLTKAQKNSLVKQLGLAYKRAGKMQFKRENMPVDMSDLIRTEEEKINSLKNETKKLLQDSYVNYLKKDTQEANMTEKKAYILLFENFYSEEDHEEKYMLLFERVSELISNMQSILDEGYSPKRLTGTELVQILEKNLNSLRGRFNRFISSSPEFIISDSLVDENELDRQIREYKEMEGVDEVVQKEKR
ncbi:hypothetical protein [Enterococcus sp. BWR-S5]|uniref:hypothetical protein n=1 Tax=Enterococcus sp. BWR-S5 TaxID=2787714 RepID=UPI001923B478|nr:hypothetical protein [Enterococcus sp. BWR-S5]MBL1227213.1 hypothetical protein [Enterococcus sp. BWR-S5]